MSPSTLNRRGFLALTGAAGIGLGLGLAGCTTTGGAAAGSGGSLSGTSLALLPTTAPSNWNAVLAKANAALQKEHGFTLNAQFINWQNYGQQSLLKFTAGAKFDSALQALWLNMAQLQQSNSLANLTTEINKWPNLKKQVSAQTIAANSWSGKLWGIPQVNSAGRIQHFTIRKDLADKLGFSDIQDYNTLEKYFYDVKQKVSDVTPFGASSNETFELALGTPSTNSRGRTPTRPTRHSLPDLDSGSSSTRRPLRTGRLSSFRCGKTRACSARSRRSVSTTKTASSTPTG